MIPISLLTRMHAERDIENFVLLRSSVDVIRLSTPVTAYHIETVFNAYTKLYFDD